MRLVLRAQIEGLLYVRSLRYANASVERISSLRTRPPAAIEDLAGTKRSSHDQKLSIACSQNNEFADMEASASSAIAEGPLHEPLLPEENVVVIAETVYDEDQSAEMMPEITRSETLCLKTGKRLMRTVRCGTIVLLRL